MINGPQITPDRTQYCIAILLVIIAAVALRLPRLQQRPMHGDEAIHAFKFGDLLERNDYRYDPDEFHGPTLNYLTLIPAWLSSADKLTDVSEFTLRIVPVFFGISLILLLLLLTDALERTSLIIAAVLTAISPAFVFYSRYYIQEMLLVCFTFGVIAFAYRYTKNKNVCWALLTGIFLGLMHATKETCIIAFASMLAAFLLMLLTQRKQSGFFSALKSTVKPVHILVVFASAVIVSVLFYSSFFRNPAGILDSLRTYTTYFDRAGNNLLHIHPWYYYLKMLLYSQYFEGPVWTEALIVILALVGLIVALTKKPIVTVNPHLLRFIAFYTVIMTILYSAIPYKTPWCMLGFLHGMILLAGVGAIVIIKLVPSLLIRTIIGLLLLAASAHLVWQSYLANYKYFADSRNPYVYAHPTTDVFTITQRLEQIAAVHPDGPNMHTQVICPGGDYWPLPWYLRNFSVRWRTEVLDDISAASVIIASSDLEQQIIKKLYELPPPGQKNLYVPLFDKNIWLRPQTELISFIPKDLWDSL